jgi:hypothetical protein
MKKFNPMNYDYLCSECALAHYAEWPEGHQATCHEGDCEFCGKFTGVCHVTDWHWRGSKQPGRREL